MSRYKSVFFRTPRPIFKLLFFRALPDTCFHVLLVAQSETLGEEGLFTATESRALTEAYITYRSRVHEMALQQLDAVVDRADLGDHIAAVGSKWKQLFAEQE